MSDVTYPYTEIVNEPVKRREERVSRRLTVATVASAIPAVVVGLPLAVIGGTRD